MSEDAEPWTFTAWGEDTLAHREARRALAEEREQRLEVHGVDPRLVDVIWRWPSDRIGALISHDLQAVSWLDDHVIATEDEGVPLCAFEFEERGVIARHGRLFEALRGGIDGAFEREVDATWVWEQALGDGLAALHPLDGAELEALLHELWQLGGPGLREIAEARINRPRG